MLEARTATEFVAELHCKEQRHKDNRGQRHRAVRSRAFRTRNKFVVRLFHRQHRCAAISPSLDVVMNGGRAIM